MLVLPINQAILIPFMKNMLLCPIQCHLNAIDVNYMPKFLLKNPIVNDHLVIIPSYDNDTLLRISFSSRVILANSLCKLQLCLNMRVTLFWIFANCWGLSPNVGSWIFIVSSQEDNVLKFSRSIVSTVISKSGQITIHVNDVASSILLYIVSLIPLIWQQLWYIPGVLCTNFPHYY